MGSKKTVPVPPVIPVRNPRRELYKLIHAEESVTCCMARDTRCKTQSKPSVFVGRLVKTVFGPRRSKKGKLPRRHHGAKKVTSNLEPSNAPRFVRRLYPEDDQNSGYNGDDEESGEEEDVDDDDEEEMEKKSEGWEEPEEVDLKLRSLDPQESEFVSFPDLPDDLEPCDSGVESDVDSLQPWDESMTDQELTAWMAKANAKVIAVSAHTGKGVAICLNPSVFKVPPEGKSTFSTSSSG